jgi:hypothetical protein
MSVAVDVEVRSTRTLFGDGGPCAKQGCARRATVIVDLSVAGIETRTWVCDEHLETLERVAAPAAR